MRQVQIVLIAVAVASLVLWTRPNVWAGILHTSATPIANDVDAGVPQPHESGRHYLFGYPIYDRPPFDHATRPDYPQQFVEPPRYATPSYLMPDFVKPSEALDPVQKPTYNRPAYLMPSDDRPLYPQLDYGMPAYQKPTMATPVYERPNYVFEPNNRPADNRPIYDKAWLNRPDYDTPIDVLPEYRSPRYLPPEYTPPPK